MLPTLYSFATHHEKQSLAADEQSNERQMS